MDTEHIRTANYEVGDDDLRVDVEDQRRRFALTSFRRTDDPALLTASAMITDKESGEITATEVSMPRRLGAAKEATFHFVERHRKAIVVVGTMTTLLAAGTGIAVHRRKRG